MTAATVRAATPTRPAFRIPAPPTTASAKRVPPSPPLGTTEDARGHRRKASTATPPKATAPATRPIAYGRCGVNSVVTSTAWPAGMRKPCCHPITRTGTSSRPLVVLATQPALYVCFTTSTPGPLRGPISSPSALALTCAAVAGIGPTGEPIRRRSTCAGRNSALDGAASTCRPAGIEIGPVAAPHTSHTRGRLLRTSSTVPRTRVSRGTPSIDTVGPNPQADSTRPSRGTGWLSSPAPRIRSSETPTGKALWNLVFASMFVVGRVVARVTVNASVIVRLNVTRPWSSSGRATRRPLPRSITTWVGRLPAR